MAGCCGLTRLLLCSAAGVLYTGSRGRQTGSRNAGGAAAEQLQALMSTFTIPVVRSVSHSAPAPGGALPSIADLVQAPPVSLRGFSEQHAVPFAGVPCWNTVCLSFQLSA